MIFSCITGTYPGFKLTGKQVPLNLDQFTWLALSLMNSPMMANFKSTLDVNGQSTATFIFPSNQPVAVGLALYFNCLVQKNPTKPAILLATNSVYILLTP